MGIERYLGSGMIKGVGPKFARRIVEQFGTDTLTVIEETPEKLIQVAGVGKHRVAAIRKAWEEQKEIKNIVIFLQEHQVSATHAVKIFKTYAENSIAVVKENPYRLADDIWGIGFKTADGIAMKMGFEKDLHLELTVLFNNIPVTYDISELDELALAYATSIHKAQGSEYPIVVMPFTMQHFVMLQRNLLYTGGVYGQVV